jgi:hypothetical protein
MKKYFSLTLLFFLCLINTYGQSFTPKEIQSINRQADSLLSFYGKYATFTIDNDQISESYISGFMGLFASANAMVINDLDPGVKADEPRKSITVESYVKYVKQNYPAGLNSADFKKVLKGTPSGTGSKIMLEVTVYKEILGYYQNVTRYNRVDTSRFMIAYDRNKRNSKIESISVLKGMDDFCTINNKEAYKLLMNRQFIDAKSLYFKTIEKCPDNDEAKNKIKLCNSKLDSMTAHKSIYLLLKVNPMISSISTVPGSTETSVTSSSAMKFCGGAALEIDLFTREKLQIGVGLGINYLTISSELTTSKYTDSVPDLTDIDNDKYTLLVSMKNVKEELTLTYVDIPVYGQLKYFLTKKFYLMGDLGVSFSFLVNSTYKTTSAAEYRGKYDEYNGIILYGNELSEYGYGQYNMNINASDSKTFNGMNINVFGKVGFGYGISRKVNAFLNIGYCYGLTNIFKQDGSGSYHLSTGNTEIGSLGGLVKGNASLITLEIGFSFKIF